MSLKINHQKQKSNLAGIQISVLVYPWKCENYEDLVGDMVKCFPVINCSVSLKLHFLDSHLDFFPQNLLIISNEHGEKFHQDISIFETCFSERWNGSMLAEYCWSVIRDIPTDAYKKKQPKKIILEFVFCIIKRLLHFCVTNL